MSVTPEATERADPLSRTLIVNEIFHSLQGETSLSGLPTVFVRLTGCPLRCRYCDTQYAFHEGRPLSIGAILEAVAEYRPRYVTVTGGEPLAQRDCPDLLRLLCDASYTVSLETGGALDISPVDPRVIRIVDLKTPGSGESARNRYENIALLTPRDQVKFVICDRADYEWSRHKLHEYALAERCEVLFSGSHGQLPDAQLAEWILSDRLPVRFQLQLHKVLWGESRGH
ncbi:MAG TPA: 7-carboxy-7-deazaguanine synthase QueE [Gammaproteobacteria bacterium]|nr:7-carboxy-7-deazaguanine synthase QueE [Gammaproteobacteria bacterium]